MEKEAAAPEGINGEERPVSVFRLLPLKSHTLFLFAVHAKLDVLIRNYINSRVIVCHLVATRVHEMHYGGRESLTHCFN